MMKRYPHYKLKNLPPKRHFLSAHPHQFAHQLQQKIGGALQTLINFIYNYPVDVIQQILNGNEEAFDRSWVLFYNNVIPHLCQLCKVCDQQYLPAFPTTSSTTGGHQLYDFIQYLHYNLGPELFQEQAPVLSIEQLINELPRLIKNILAFPSNLTHSPFQKGKLYM